MKCILNVTDHEYDEILQFTNGRIEWVTGNAAIDKGLEALLDAGVVKDISGYKECRMEKYADISGMPRVAPELDSAPTRVE